MAVELDRAEEARLIEACRAGEDAAWARVYALWAPTVATFLRRHAGAGADIDDLVQQVFVELFSSVSRFRAEARLSTWLYRIAARVAAKDWRSRGRHERRVEAWAQALGVRGDASAGPEAHLGARETLGVVDEVLAGLKPIHRSVWLLSAVEGLSLEEMSDVLKIRLGTVRSRLTKARRLVTAGLQRRGVAPSGAVGVSLRLSAREES